MITPAAGPSVYAQIAAELRQQITTGQIPAGQYLLSELTLEQAYGVSRTTIRRAIAILRHEGLVTVRRGHRVRVRDRSELQDLTVPVGAVVTARMPTPAERDHLGVGEGVPVLVVTAPDGTVSVFPADRWQLRYRP